MLNQNITGTRKKNNRKATTETLPITALIRRLMPPSITSSIDSSTHENGPSAWAAVRKDGQGLIPGMSLDPHDEIQRDWDGLGSFVSPILPCRLSGHSACVQQLGRELGCVSPDTAISGLLRHGPHPSMKGIRWTGERLGHWWCCVFNTLS